MSEIEAEKEGETVLDRLAVFEADSLWEGVRDEEAVCVLDSETFDPALEGEGVLVCVGVTEKDLDPDWVLV